MIDTWARHLAAVSEARRLIKLVLDNNPAFQELDGGPFGGAAGSPAADALARDPHYTAYVHLTAALDALKPVPAVSDLAGGIGLPLVARLAEIAPALPRRANPVRPEAAPELASLERLRQRLRYVLETAPESPAVVAPLMEPAGGEARVAIVRNAATRGPTSPAHGSAPK